MAAGRPAPSACAEGRRAEALPLCRAYVAAQPDDAVMLYNNARESFPGNIVAGWFSFRAAELLEIESEEKREVPQVSFQ